MPKKDDIYEYNNEKFIFVNKYYGQRSDESLDVGVCLDKLNCDERYSFKEDFFNENFTKVERTKKEKITGKINDIANFVINLLFPVLFMGILVINLCVDIEYYINTEALLKEKNVCENVHNAIMKK